MEINSTGWQPALPAKSWLYFLTMTNTQAYYDTDLKITMQSLIVQA
jgi:hypothetical protein